MKWARDRVTLFALGVLVMAGCKKAGPRLEDFQCGGVAGYLCPPASTCGGCREPDCIAGCYASTRCDPAAPACPGGYTCDGASQYCIPAKVCDTNHNCPTGQSCATHLTSKGICTPGP